MRTRGELADALERAFKQRGKFSLIEVMLPRGKTSDTLARFVAGFKAHRARAAATKAGASKTGAKARPKSARAKRA